MNTEKLSKRLETVAKYIPEGAKFADIGSDHAYLPCYMLKKNKASFAIAGEVVEGPYKSACTQVRQEGLTSVISVRKGNGLEVVELGEVDCITIAGMGGSLIASILEQGKKKLSTVKRLILQPNIHAYAIRVWLLENKWKLVREEIIEEDGKIYEVLVAEQGKMGLQDKLNEDAVLLLGPFLMQEKNSIFQKKWTSEINNWQRILAKLKAAPDSEENNQKKKELIEKITLVEEVLFDETN
ncbi:tRNA (adenine(22)-N(1))-methyltransferase TrmK [Niallia sp. NCCP-28]|uniref:tRNA (adenine(22)-N(1))-methyltransferase n=1 Tax=Niallia sp. NCCP-28 TaxID=2934712 RepID=UPI00208875F6|nr:tRNA (adenine(22)-N(1))-methyltransferase TrmK [Niallia sp. NCCP-28]GKU81290.1 tRNA (adenine(22)-N(1))-methyltransferase [Niallia sp. NCCP-28]